MAFIASLAPVEIDAAALSALAELCAVASPRPKSRLQGLPPDGNPSKSRGLAFRLYP